MRKLVTTVLVSAIGLGALAASAQAATLGSLFPPDGSVLIGGCGDPDEVILQATSDPSRSYTVPGPGTITQWQLITTDDSSGEGVTLVILKPNGAAFDVLAADARTIADPAPSISSFTLATPVAVSGGETFGLYTHDGPDVPCYFQGGDTPAGNTLAALAAPDPPAAGQTLARDEPDSDPGYSLNLEVNFVPTGTTAPPTNTTSPPAKHKKKCKKHKKRSAESAKKKKCKKHKRH